jgi:hypothetical protein
MSEKKETFYSVNFVQNLVPKLLLGNRIGRQAPAWRKNIVIKIKKAS